MYGAEATETGTPGSAWLPILHPQTRESRKGKQFTFATTGGIYQDRNPPHSQGRDHGSRRAAMKPGPRMSRALACAVILLCSSAPALSGVHLWRVEEVFSNADGTVQFIEMATCSGSTSEVFTGGQVLRSNANSFTFPANLSGSTLNKHILLATAAFAALPGAPTPDQIIVDHFFSTDTDTISFSVYDTLIFASGALPTDGVTSLNKDPNDATDTTFTAPNSPTNFADQTGSVNAAGGPPAVPDGTGGTTPMTVAALTRDGSSLRVSFDVASCTNAADHHILFG